MTGIPPWKEEPFRDFAASSGIGDALRDAEISLKGMTYVDAAACSHLDSLFRDYMGGDLSHASVARMITAQGYETVNNLNRYIETYLDGRPSRLYVLTDDVPSPSGRMMFVSFGDWNVHRKDGVDFYPLFALGVLKAVDPMFKNIC